MIVSLEGRLVESTTLTAVVETGGVGYEVNVPLTTSERLPAPGHAVKLHTLAVYREDGHHLFGFATREDRDFFRLLVEKVSGVGPRTALAIFSRLSAATLKDAIARGDVKMLSQCQGVGKKTAERIVIELRDKVFSGVPTALSSESLAKGVAPSAFQDAVAALIALGYKAPDADKAIRHAAAALGHDAATEALVKRALGSV